MNSVTEIDIGKRKIKDIEEIAVGEELFEEKQKKAKIGQGSSEESVTLKVEGSDLKWVPQAQ